MPVPGQPRYRGFQNPAPKVSERAYRTSKDRIRDSDTAHNKVVKQHHWNNKPKYRMYADKDSAT
jgi:hypothetical protein